MPLDAHIHLRSFSPRDVSGYRIVGCPKCISDKKYDRNAFIFNSVFVFDSTTDTSPYEPIIQKLGDAFRTYEVGTCSAYIALLHCLLKCVAQKWGPVDPIVTK